MSAYVTLSVSEASYSVANNTSEVDITFSVVTSGPTYNQAGDTSGYVRIDGSQVANLAGKTFARDTTTVLYSGRHTIYHNSDGSKSISVTAGFDLNTSTYGWMYQNKDLQLTTIPRASTLEKPDLTIGVESILTIKSASSSFTHSLTYTIGSATETIYNKSPYHRVRWTPPQSLLSQIPDGSYKSITFTCETFSGGTKIGTTTTVGVLRVPDSVIPSIQDVTLTPVNSNEFLKTNNLYVEGYTKVNVKTVATAGQGSTIKRVEIYGQGVGGGTGADWTSDVLRDGTLDVRVTVYDTRGRKAQVTKNLVVLSYRVPLITTGTAFRCDSQGTAEASGEFVSALCSASFTSLRNLNKITTKARSRTVGGYWGSYTELTPGQSKILPNFSALKSYEVELSVVDSLGEGKEVVILIPTASVTLHLNEGGTGLAVGKFSEKPGFECGMEADFQNNVHGRVYGLGELPPIRVGSDLNDFLSPGVWGVPSETTAKGLKNIPEAVAGTLRTWCSSGTSVEIGAYTRRIQEYTTYTDHSYRRLITSLNDTNLRFFEWRRVILEPYPVGSIYMSTNSTSPASLFGGQWERIYERFLLAANSYYTAGSTGGESSHKLTTEELPNHYHGIGERNNEGRYGPHYAIVTENGKYDWSVENSGSVGSDKPHNNMPPYLAVYMWKRVG